jgi:hypothetical protein
MPQQQRRYLLAALCILFFIAAQTFQEFAYRLWIPAAHGPEQELHTYLLPIDRARALLIMASIVSLIVPYVVIALRYRRIALFAAVLGLIFGAAFKGFELSTRSVDFFVVGQSWARAFQAGDTAAGHAAILHRYVVWSDMVRGLYFPLMLSHLLASCAFAYAIWQEHDRWSRLASLAFMLNALRLLGRISSTFGGQLWLDPLNNTAYYPVVLVINGMLAAWFFHLAATSGQAVPEREDQ